MGRVKHSLAVIVLVLGLLINLPSTTYAACLVGQQSCSGGYGVSEVFFGSGGSLDSTCSTGYCAKQSLGETAVGSTSSSGYTAHAGFNTNREPYIEIQVSSSTVNLGVLSTTSTATGTAAFSVKAYLASGYTVQTVSSGLTYGSHVLSPIASATTSAVGSEQFGINLVSNTTACGAPVNFGADPVQVPSASFSYGVASSGYNTCGKFQYINNSSIADSNESSGETDYTISYIANISNVTPAGYYQMNQSLVAVGKY